MSGEAALVDTNILVYAYDVSEKEKHKACKELVESCHDRRGNEDKQNPQCERTAFLRFIPRTKQISEKSSGLKS